jgi:hypothetical protein
MKFVWVASVNRFRRTETEVKKERLKYEVVEFETDKDSLIDRFNRYEERIEELQRQLDGGAPAIPHIHDDEAQIEEIPAPAPAPAAPKTDEQEMRRRLAESLRGMEVEAIEDKILEAKPNHMARYLSCAISRLGELGREGWEHFHAQRAFGDAEASQRNSKFKHLSMYSERGLRYMALMQVADLNGKAETA